MQLSVEREGKAAIHIVANSYIYSHFVDYRVCGIQPVNTICTEPYIPLSYKANMSQCSVGIHIYIHIHHGLQDLCELHYLY